MEEQDRNRDNNSRSSSDSSRETELLTGSNFEKPEITGILDERIRNLREAIEEIDDAITHRKVLNIRFMEQIEKERQEAINQLGTLQPPWRAGFYPQLEFMRLSLHKSITSRSHDHRTEQLKYWENVINLQKERRKFMDEYKSLLAAKRRLKSP